VIQARSRDGEKAGEEAATVFTWGCLKRNWWQAGHCPGLPSPRKRILRTPDTNHI